MVFLVEEASCTLHVADRAVTNEINTLQRGFHQSNRFYGGRQYPEGEFASLPLSKGRRVSALTLISLYESECTFSNTIFSLLLSE